MDQLRKAWAWLKLQHFWVLTVLVLLIAIACWWYGAQKLYKEFVANRSTIQNAFKAQQDLRAEPFHANDSINKQQEIQIANQRKNVQELWKELYERQRKAVLKWPSNLSEQFHRYIDKLKFGENIPVDLRNHYNNYVREHFPELPKIVGALEMAGDEQGGGSRGGYGGRGMEGRGPYREGRYSGRDSSQATGEETEEQDFIVEWLDQQRVRDELYLGTTPSAKRIWKTQEDLWVYEALLGIIAKTNAAKGADRNSNAAIRVIETLEVGQLAAQASRMPGRIDMVLPPAAAGGGEMAGERGSTDPRAMLGEGGGFGREGGMRGGGGEGAYGEGREGEMGGRGVMSGEGESDANLFNGRYVDAEGKPIAPSGEIGPSTFGTEFKRLPVRMSLVMDQRWLPQLISECANAPLQVEIEEVHVNPTGSSGGGGYGGGRDFRGGRGGYSEGMSTMSGQSGMEMTPESEPTIKPVVIQGIIYIFNPPEEEPATSQVAETQ